MGRVRLDCVSMWPLVLLGRWRPCLLRDTHLVQIVSLPNMGPTQVSGLAGSLCILGLLVLLEVMLCNCHRLLGLGGALLGFPLCLCAAVVGLDKEPKTNLPPMWSITVLNWLRKQVYWAIWSCGLTIPWGPLIVWDHQLKSRYSRLLSRDGCVLKHVPQFPGL